ncbi:MAG: RdgB/HAM1 family non-canonical purine NTP pyrophosphatase [Deltaproteobacteria bacterium]|nr:RdgB/HAM1 family non-canonical purine NTP pyrophosphatase [Deltaproteobacteria bacterium]
MKRLLVATHNAGKIREIAALLGGSVEIETLLDHPELEAAEETGATFAENARMKAEHASRALGIAALADDSGLVVDALDGAPGVRSARYAPGTDADRVTKLLRALHGVERERRAARFVCAMAFSAPGAPTVITEGIVEGRIALAARGHGGFGYDPVFEVEGGTDEGGTDEGGTVEGRTKTMAELAPGRKNLISHRARALEAMRPALLAHFSLVLGGRRP